MREQSDSAANVGASRTLAHRTHFPPFFVSFLSGGIAGVVAKSAIAPLERVKILFQIRSKHYPFTGVLPTMLTIAKRESVFGLWKGNWATIVRIFPYAAIQFVAFEKLKHLLVPNSTNNETYIIKNMIAGSLAGISAVLCTYPLDLIRVRMAVDVERQRTSGVLTALRGVYHTEGGVRALFRGIGPTLMGIAPYAGTNFAAYETLKVIVPKNKDGQLSTPMKLACGGLAGAIGQTVGYPLDVVRRQMQTMGFAAGHGHWHKNTWAALKTIVAEDGWRGLFRGLSINYMKAIPMVGISFTVFENTKKLLSQWNQR